MDASTPDVVNGSAQHSTLRFFGLREIAAGVGITALDVYGAIQLTQERGTAPAR